MLKKHLAVMLLLFMAVGAFAQSIPSGTGRYEALGSSPFILDAATDINNNPAWNTQYRNYAFGDIGRDYIGTQDFQLSGQYAGATFGVSKKLNLGMILNKRDDYWNLFNANPDEPWRPNNNDVSEPIVPFKGLIGYTASKNFHLGLAPYFAYWKSDYTDTDTNQTTYDRSATSLGGTLGFIYMIKKGWVEGALKFGMNSFKFETTTPIGGARTLTTTVESNGGIHFGAGFRAWIYPKTNSKLAIVPLLGFSSYSWNPKQTSPTAVEGLNYSWLNLNGGVGINIPVLDDIQIAGGLVVEYNSSKADSGAFEYKRTDFVLPRFNLAGETSIAEWLTARFGYSRSVTMVKIEQNPFAGRTIETNYLEASDYAQTVSLGAGFHFGRFSIDGTVSERWLKEGINFVSGGDNDLFGVISASYNFNN
jgi:hypothetical protein